MPGHLNILCTVELVHLYNLFLSRDSIMKDVGNSLSEFLLLYLREGKGLVLSEAPLSSNFLVFYKPVTTKGHFSPLSAVKWLTLA